MKYKKRFFTMCILILFVVFVQAQNTSTASGGEASGSGGSTSYSVGQVAYQTHTGTTGSVAQGVQQPYEISVVTGLEEAKGINLSILAYPNPTTDNLTLEVRDFELSALTFQLYDMNGRLLQTEKITGNLTGIEMGRFVPATYFVKIAQNNSEVKTFKIIKTQ